MNETFRGPKQSPGDGRTDAYLDWWRLAEGRRFIDTENGKSSDPVLFGTATIPREAFGFDPLLSGASKTAGFRNGADFTIPLPARARNPNLKQDRLDEEGKPEQWTFDPEEFPDIQEGDVIVGIIDNDIALGQRRFRFSDGSTRLLAAWQQGANWVDEVEGYSQSHLYFGNELSRKDINELLAKHSTGGDLQGRLNEHAFNTEAGLINPDLPAWEGSKGLQLHNAHGTHVLDLAAGFEPAEHEKGGRKPLCHIIAVSLPPQFFHGQGGNFLQYHAVLGFNRILEIVDGLSRHHLGCGEFFPTVINFSYGMQAGSKDGMMTLEQAIRDRLARRRSDVRRSLGRNTADGGAPPPEPINPRAFVNMPAGNSNLVRATAELNLRAGQSETLELLVQPNDHTSSYVEFWSAPVPFPEQRRNEFCITISPPGRDDIPVHLDLGNGTLSRREIAGREQHIDLLVPDTDDVYARLYLRLYDAHDDPSGNRQVRLRALLCIAPTLLFHEMRDGGSPAFEDRPDLVTAPAGVWNVTLETKQTDLRFEIHVQSDQTGLPNRQNARRAYFDDRNYRDYLETGRVRDSFLCSDPTQPLDTPPVTRVGSFNALASGPDVAMIAGYRVSDGCPAPFSATAYPEDRDGGDVSYIDATYPTDDGETHFGLIAAGALDGTVATLRGTSMSTALATREMLEELLQDPDSHVGPRWLRQQASLRRGSDLPAQYIRPAVQKGGEGHLPHPERHRRPKIERRLT